MGQRQSEIIKNHMEVYWHDYASASKGIPITEAGLVEKASVIGRTGLMLLECGTGAWRVRSSMNTLSRELGVTTTADIGLLSMRDIDYGIFPFTSSSNTLAAYAPLGAGIPNCKLDHVVGVLKSYSTCVGAGPFAAENAMGEEWNEKLRKAGGEYGAATGRPRRIGPFDCVASRYGLACQGADKIALTKLDVLSSMEEIPVITGYKLDGVKVPRFDTLSDLDRMEPVVTMLPGWNKDISGCKSWDELPKEAKGYVEFLEKQLDHEIQFVSTGAEREKFVLKGEWL